MDTITWVLIRLDLLPLGDDVFDRLDQSEDEE
jgi:hypothetical protein